MAEQIFPPQTGPSAGTERVSRQNRRFIQQNYMEIPLPLSYN